MKELLDLIERTLDAVLPQERPDVLFSAMRYAVPDVTTFLRELAKKGATRFM